MLTSINDLGVCLFGLLRRMDAEATTLTPSGNATGLSDYGRHARTDLTRPQNEVEWSRRLAQLLAESGIAADLELEYPNQDDLPRRSRKRRDLYVKVPKLGNVSIEVKGAWSDYWGRRHTIYRTYLLHPLLPGLDASKSHTAPLDLVKLSTLRAPETDYVALLLVGFEIPEDPMDVDIEQLASLAGLSEWSVAQDAWMSPTVAGQRVRCWFWFRAADGRWSLPVPKA